MKSRRLSFTVATAGTLLAAIALAGAPAAVADECTVTVSVLGGQKYNFVANVAPGTPVAQIPVPAGLLPQGAQIAGETESCGAPSTTTSSSSTSTSGNLTPSSSTSSTSSSSSTSSPTSTSTTRTTGTTTSSSSTTQRTTSAKGPGSRQTPSSKKHSSAPEGASHRSTAPKHQGGAHPAKPKPAKTQTHTQTTTTSTTTTTTRSSSSASSSSGATSIGSATIPSGSGSPFSFALPGSEPIGVPNFFIENFQIPPFLLPIYQAAGIQYNVPWQVLAAINEIETDYGRDLSVSSAGAVGWMQFLPSTWKQWGVDATGSGVADPYNPADAIFAAARYLHAAGASTNLNNAIFAYNHAEWYVQSVLLRAKLIAAMPSPLVGALTGLVEGRFPVAAAAKYADGSIDARAKKPVSGANAAIPVQSDSSSSTAIFAKQGSPVIAVNDGKIIKLGYSQQLGNYIELQDSTGNIYTYANLGQVSKMYPVPKPVKMTAAEVAQEFSGPAATSAPQAPATAGAQQSSSSPSSAAATKQIKQGTTLPTTSAPASSPAPSAPLVKERLFADPSRPASYAAGGALQTKETAPQLTSFNNYFSDVLHLARSQYTLEPLQTGSIVVAGTILGRIAPAASASGAHVTFMIRPAGNNAPAIDPKPILDGWKLLQATDVYRASGIDPFVGANKNPSIGQILLMSKDQLTDRVLSDPNVQIYPCGRRDIEAGLIDRRVLAVVEFLSSSGLDPDVTGLDCGHTATGAGGVDAAGATGASVDISKVNNTPIEGHQGAGSITDLTIRRLLTLQGAMAPDQIISTMSYKGQSNTVSQADHANRIQITYTPEYGANNKLSAEAKAILQPGQWTALIKQISQIQEPVVPITPSRYAIRTSS